MSTPEYLTHFLIAHQTFEGSWDTSSIILQALQAQNAIIKSKCGKAGVSEKIFFTALVVAVFEQSLKEFEGGWEPVVEKARGWFGEQVEDVHALVGRAGELVK